MRVKLVLINFNNLQIGIFVVYFLDTGLGSGWWVMVLYLALLFAVMVVRGKPYGAEQIVTVLFPKKVSSRSRFCRDHHYFFSNFFFLF